MNTLESDVIVVGAGAAGATAAVVAAEAGARVALLSKEPVGYGSTRISGGEMASSGLGPEDGPELLLRDILVGGECINDVQLAKAVAEEASEANRLVESFGQMLRRDAQGHLNPEVAARPGGQQYHRSLFSPARGKSMGKLCELLLCALD
jgi:succinate dehydrogenase/fumarate reductase flavoprotein subunit